MQSRDAWFAPHGSATDEVAADQVAVRGGLDEVAADEVADDEVAVLGQPDEVAADQVWVFQD